MDNSATPICANISSMGPSTLEKTELLTREDHASKSLSSEGDDSSWAVEMPTPIENGAALMNCINDKIKNICEDKRNSLTETLPVDIIFKICEYLNVKSLLHLGSCSSGLYSISSRDEASWSTRCNTLWASKNLVCERAKEVFGQRTRFKRPACLCQNKFAKCQCLGFKSVGSRNAKEAYKISVLDAKRRHEITAKELCEITWSFRFKEAAGLDWTVWDPWWSGSEAQKMTFMSDGRVIPVQNEHSSPKNESQNQSSNTLDSNVDQEQDLNQPRSRPGRTSPMESVDMKWRFITSPLDLTARPPGGYIRLSVGGREVPTYVVRRSTTGNWGFIMENCWGVYLSFEMPRRGSVSKLEDRGMFVTNLRQWREALLYNNGANRLPEGRLDVLEFNKIWNEAFQIIRQYQRH